MFRRGHTIIGLTLLLVLLVFGNVILVSATTSIGWANLEYPPSITHTINTTNPTDNIYGQVWIDGITYEPGPSVGLIAQVGYGPLGSNPDSNSDWIWVDAVWYGDVGNNDEFIGQLFPEAVGVYDYAYRFSTTGGADWLYADLDGSANGYDPTQAGDLEVNPSLDTTPPYKPSNLHIVEVSSTSISLGWDTNPDVDLGGYEIFRQSVSSPGFSRLARIGSVASSYTDMDVVAEETYEYFVLAYDTSFNFSDQSDVITASADYCSSVTEIPKSECEALVALYNGTDGDTWVENTGWMVTNTPCSWYGVSCDPGNVTGLFLVNNQLSGTIPAELANLSELRESSLSGNHLSGNIPPELGNLLKLQSLNLSRNNLSGSIPPELGKMTRMSDLILSKNYLSGIIPPELGNLSNLQALVLGGNSLSGEIPSELGNLSNLLVLSISDTQVSGSIPPELGNLSSLVQLNLQNTQLSGNRVGKPF